MAERLPFTFTPNIVRYLKHAVDLHTKWTQGAPVGHDYGLLSFDLPTYEEGEAIFIFTEASRLSFIKYFTNEKINFMHFTGEEHRGFYFDRVSEWGKPGSFCLYKEQTHFFIKDIMPILKVWKLYLAQKENPKLAFVDLEFEKVSFDAKEARLIYFNKSYTFHKGKKVKAPRLKIFEHLWEERHHIVKESTTKKGRFLSVEAIEKLIGRKVMMSDFYNLEAALKKKHMPIRINREGENLQLIVDEKS